MNRLDKRRIGRERLHRDFGIALDDHFNLVFQLCDGRRQRPRQLLVDLLPQALDGIELGRLGGQEQAHPMGRGHQ